MNRVARALINRSNQLGHSHESWLALISYFAIVLLAVMNFRVIDEDLLNARIQDTISAAAAIWLCINLLIITPLLALGNRWIAKARIAKANKKAARALINKGNLLSLHDTPAAMRTYARAVELDANNPEGWNQLGHMQRRLRMFDAAEQSYKQHVMVRRLPVRPDAYRRFLRHPADGGKRFGASVSRARQADRRRPRDQGPGDGAGGGGDRRGRHLRLQHLHSCL